MGKASTFFLACRISGEALCSLIGPVRPCVVSFTDLDGFRHAGLRRWWRLATRSKRSGRSPSKKNRRTARLAHGGERLRIDEPSRSAQVARRRPAGFSSAVLFSEGGTISSSMSQWKKQSSRSIRSWTASYLFSQTASRFGF